MSCASARPGVSRQVENRGVGAATVGPFARQRQKTELGTPPTVRGTATSGKASALSARNLAGPRNHVEEIYAGQAATSRPRSAKIILRTFLGAPYCRETQRSRQNSPLLSILRTNACLRHWRTTLVTSFRSARKWNASAVVCTGAQFWARVGPFHGLEQGQNTGPQKVAGWAYLIHFTAFHFAALGVVSAPLTASGSSRP